MNTNRRQGRVVCNGFYHHCPDWQQVVLTGFSRLLTRWACLQATGSFQPCGLCRLPAWGHSSPATPVQEIGGPLALQASTSSARKLCAAVSRPPCPAGNKIPLPQRDPSDFVRITRVVNKEDILAEGPRDVLLSKVDRAQQMQLGDDRLSVTSRKGYRMVRQAVTCHSMGSREPA